MDDEPRLKQRLGPPWDHDWKGQLHEHVIESEALTGNPLGDPHRRPLWVYTPPGYGNDAERRYPTIYLIQGLTGQIDMWRARKAFRRSVPELMDELFAAPDQSPALVVYVDCWTSLGGSQYLDSPATGRYLTYLCDEVIPWVDGRFRTLPDSAHRAIDGKSSGGYGAMVLPMLRPDRFGALATHAGDALFEVCYLPEFGDAVRALRDRYDGSFDQFWTDMRSRPGVIRPGDMELINAWCMAACYSADADGTVRLPFDPQSGRLLPEIWDRWLDHDPVRMVARHAEALRGLKGIWIDAGRQDQWHLDVGAEAYRRELAAIGVDEPTVRFELFEGTHSDIEYRYPAAIGWLAERISP